jgi:hypothetical protein
MYLSFIILYSILFEDEDFKIYEDDEWDFNLINLIKLIIFEDGDRDV